MEVSQITEQRLYEEVKGGLQDALEVYSGNEAVRVALSERRNERLIERYSKLSKAERFFFDVVDRDIDWQNIDPQLHWVSSSLEGTIWDYARNIVSSMPENSVIGRQMRYYFVDANSGRWLGIVCLASALTLTSPRHQRLKWDAKTRFANLAKLLNIAVCVPIQPFGTLCGGKLLFVSSLSNEIRARYEEQYSDDLLAVETTSLYGKSSQYNRVKEFEYLGLTKGDGNIHVSGDLWNSICQYLAIHPEYDTAGNSSVKLRRINDVARAVGLSGTTSTHGHRRGYYWGVTAENSEELLQGKCPDEPRYFDRPLALLTDFWMQRWYKMRLPKKWDDIVSFDPSVYALDRNVLDENRGARQLWLI